MENQFRCDCPITSALDILGDKWNLVIVKQMLLEGRRTFKDFLEGDEAIATNILSSRLKLLQKTGIVFKRKLAHNHKTHFYLLTDKGLALAPILAELALWSDKHLRVVHPELQNGEPMEILRGDKAGFTKMMQTRYVQKEQL